MLRISILFALSLYSFSAIAQELGATRREAACQKNRQDSFDRGWRISPNSRDFAGLCVDASARRPVEILTESENEFRFANFYHENRFWIARWVKSDIPKAHFVILHFNVDVPILGSLVQAAHTELRFQFDRGLDLYSPATGESRKVKDVVINWEAAGPDGVSFNLLAGFFMNQPIFGRVLSMESRLLENIIAPGKMRKTQQRRLRLDPIQSTLLFETSLRDSNKSSADEFYRTIGNNCTTKPFSAIDKVLKATAPGMLNGVPPFSTPWARDPIAGPSERALLMRQLIQKASPTLSQAAEFGLQE